MYRLLGWMLCLCVWVSVEAGACLAQSGSSASQTVESLNFRVHASTKDIAQQVADTAEECRQQLAIGWFGHRLPRWANRCEVYVQLGNNLGAGGATKFKFDQGQVYDWDMRVQGSLERVLDSVIPHEVNHTILACYFRRPVPRWADEGAATMVEHESEQSRQLKFVSRLVNQGQRIPLRVLFDITQYPTDSDQVMALYSEGFSLTEYLIQQGGHKQFLLFLNDAHHRGWDAAVKSYYKHANVESLEREWMNWVIAGQPKLNLPEGELLAQQNSGSHRVNEVVRSQNPDGNEGEPRQEAGHSTPAGGTRSADWRGSIRFDPVAAPDPRRSRAFDFVAVPLAATSNERGSQDEVQPLILVRLDMPAQTDSVLTVGHKSAGLEARLDLAPPVVSEVAAFGTRLRETRLRSDVEPKSSGQFLDWAQFPKSRH